MRRVTSDNGNPWRPTSTSLAGSCAATLCAVLAVMLSRTVAAETPLLEFPEAGIDDPAAYAGYRTRIYRDALQNTFQVYLDGGSGRVVNVWADAANASAGFTVRDGASRPASLDWDDAAVETRLDGARRSMTYRLRAAGDSVRIGWFLQGTMRQERDFQRTGWHLRPYADGPFVLPEFSQLVATVAALPDEERRRHLDLLGAASVAALRGRLTDTTVFSDDAGGWTLTTEHVSLDGRHSMSLAVSGAAGSTARADGAVLTVRAAPAGGIALTITVTTDNTALTPLDRGHLFNTEFADYVAAQTAANPASPVTVADRRRLTRSLVGLELLVSAEKTMAALPNYATYFGRDSIMAALMLEPVTTADFQESVIANALHKVSSLGEVSHEEAVGEQAIRENAADYVALVRKWRESGDGMPAEDGLAPARALLRDLQAVRENYRMVDDDFQLPVLVARYLARTDIADERKREFLLDGGADAAHRRDRLLRNVALVLRFAKPYADRQVATNLVGFQFRDAAGWMPGSWRDSRPGYGNGRFAMDVNAFWVPNALAAAARILAALDGAEVRTDDLVPRDGGDTTALETCLADPTVLRDAIAAWRGARRHFIVELTPAEIDRRVKASLDALPPVEQHFWSRRLPAATDDTALRFLALALYDDGTPVPVVNTDPAISLFLDDYTDGVRDGTLTTDAVGILYDSILRPYPVGLFVDGVGPLAANDFYADESAQQGFRDDSYHSPRTIWGRDVNLLAMGLARQVAAAYGPDGRLTNASDEFRRYVENLRNALDRVLDAVAASGMQHNEVWSYRVDEAGLYPLRLAVSSDVQLWNLTDLAVRYQLDRLPLP